jgi:hypothetical protein
MSSLLFAHRCHVLNAIFFLVCFYFFPVGSGVDVSNDIELITPEDQYLSIDELVKKKNHGYLFYLVINNKASSPPSEPMVSKYFKTYYFATYGSTVFYR